MQDIIQERAAVETDSAENKTNIPVFLYLESSVDLK